jgi:two-component system sensor histidine kinase UhpB
LDALWYRRSIRTQLLITLVLINCFTALIGGGITILEARRSTRIEIAASMQLAEALVRETIQLMQQEVPAERSLAKLPTQLRLVRHVRVTVRDTHGTPIGEPSLAPDQPRDHAPAPGWFIALIAPPVETREVPIVIGERQIGSVLLSGKPGDEIAEVWETTRALAAVALLVNLAVIAILYVLFGRVLGPLKGLAAGLNDLERRNYEVRLPRPKARELALIVDRFNALAEALTAMRAENTSLNRRLITAQDDERRRTALELHDEVGPCLFGLKASATSLANASAPEAVRERAREMLAIIEHLQTINRSLLNRLRPMALGHVPVKELLSSLVNDRARRHPDIVLSFTSGDLLASYGDSIDLTLYRCIQEGLTNALRHAGARHIAIDLRHARDPAGADREARLTLTIRDDGHGIDPHAPIGLGIQGMQERVRALGGDCSIASAPDEGTSVRITIPVQIDAVPAVDHRGHTRE